MSTLTMNDVASQLAAFRTKYNRETTLSLDDIEGIVMNAEADMSDEDFAEAFFEAETPDSNDDRSAPDVVTAGSGWSYAAKLDDKEFREHLETNAKAALENKRGAAVLRRDLIRLFTLATIESVWPIPGSTEKTHPGINRALHKYPTIVKDADGMDKAGTGDWYADLFDGSADGKAWAVQSASLKSVKANETGKHILPEHEKLRGDEVKLVTARSALDSHRTNKKNAIIRTVNLIQKMARINEETEAVVRLVTENGKDDGDPVASNKLLFLKNTKDETQFRVLTIGQILALNVDKAKANANGATYTALIGTTGRAANSGTGSDVQNVKVDSIKQFDDVTAAYATFFDKLVNDPKATNALLTHLNGAGSDDLLLSLNAVMNGIDGYLSKPGISARLSKLLADGKQVKAA